jgi:Zn finger protein HypA/HybF involved in hydrogenase expression
MDTRLKCKRCGESWDSYTVALKHKLPKFCPFCHSYKWNVSRKIKK